MKLHILVFVCFICYSLAEEEWVDNPEAPLPPEMIICKRNDPNRDECIKKSMQSLLPALANGYEPLGLVPIDPFFVPVVNMQLSTGSINVKMTAKNATTYGFKETEVRRVRSKVNDQKMHLEIELYHPQLVMEALYKGEGNLNELRYKSKGFTNTTLTGVTATWKMNGVIETRNGEEYMKIVKFDTKPAAKHVKIYADGMFPDPDLNQFALEFVNQNWKQLYEQMFPQTRQIWEPIVLSSVNKVFGRVPFRRLMPKE